LSENKLEVVPSCVGSLTSLNRLDLHSNNIHTLPEELGQLKQVMHKVQYHFDLILEQPF
jgi:Leucine-rich repeat (LRR) protein